MAGPSSSALDPTDLDQSIDNALAMFQAILSDTQRQELQDIKKNHATTDADAVLVFTAELDLMNRQRRGRSTATRLHTFLSAVGDFCTIMTDGRPCNVVDTYVSSNPETAALVWGSVKLTMTIITNFMSYNDGVFNLLMDITKSCPIVSEYRSLYPDSIQLQKSLSSFYAAIIRCCRHLVQVMQHRGSYMRIARNLAMSINQEFKQDLDDIQKCRKDIADEVSLAKARADLLYQQLQAKEREEASHNRKAQNHFFASTGSTLHKIRTQQTQISNAESARMRQQLLDSLSTHDFTRPFKQANEKRYGNTTRWVFETPQFQQWLNGESSILWCSGKIGSGKTTVASSAIQHILNVEGSLGHPVSFFFAQYDNASSLDSCVILSSILRQILQRSNISKAIERKIRSIVESSTSKEICELLHELILLHPKCYILIDGLDQCERIDRKEVLGTLSVLVSCSRSTRIFLSSRISLHNELQKQFPVLQHLTLDCDATNDDIATYISGFIDEKIGDSDLVVGDPALASDVKTALVNGAQGMFLWASLQLEDICCQHCDDDIRHTLDNLPKDLADTFLRALHRIKYRKHSNAAQKVFPWVAGAKRPLSLEELREAIAVQIGQKYSEPGRLYNDIGNITSWCENLIQVDEESQVVQFAHSTVRDFLLEESSSHNTEDFHMRLKDIDHTLGEICVTYVDFNDFKRTLAVRSKPMEVDPSNIIPGLLKPGSNLAALARKLLPKRNTAAYNFQSNTAFRQHASRSRITTLEDGHPFLKYASVNWITHTTSFQETTSKMWSLWKTIVEDGHDIAQRPWGQSFHNYAVWKWAFQNRHYALIQLLITHSMFPGLGAGLKARLLQDAILEDDCQVIDVLVGASWSSKALDQALKLASHRGQLKMVQSLLAAKAGVNAEPSYKNGRTALQAAAEGGYLDVVEILLLAKADVNAEPSLLGGRTALQAAAGGGHIDVVERLLLAKVNVNAEPSIYNGWTALQAAAGGGHIDVVERLLLEKANVNAKPSYENGRTALQAAAEGGHINVVERLLLENADVNAELSESGGRTALQAAAGGGHIDVVERLLLEKANVNAKPSYENGRTALQAAAGGGHINIVKRLLLEKANVNAKPSYENGRTALQAAAEGGHINVVERLLLEKAGINAEPSHKNGRTALQAAAGGGHINIVKRLLLAKADVNAEPSLLGGQTALQAAAGGGHINVVERLLLEKADVNAEISESSGQTALQAAAGGGHIDVVERLLLAKADVNAEPSLLGGRTALQAAAGGGHIDVVERLLLAKADVNAEPSGSDGQTALQAAVGGGYIDIVDLLRLAGAR